MAISNQGYRRDLNLQETTNDTVALDNLAGAGTADDISFLQNNLRNTSNIAFNYVTSDGFFSFDTDRLVSASSIVSTGSSDTNGNPIDVSTIQVGLTNPYLFKFGDIVELQGITENASLNGQYSVNAVSPDLETITFVNSGIHTSITPSLSGVTFKLKAQNIFTFTDGDVVNLSEDVTFNITSGITTLTSNINYYVVESNGINKFKLSTTENGTSVLPTSGVSGGTPDNFQFKRQDAVHQQQVINYIPPDIQDTAEFSYPDDVNSTIDETQSDIESAEYFTLKKYRSDQSITTPDSIKFEGSINLHDPKDYNVDGNIVQNKNPDGSTIPNAPAPGVYIGDTRAFSSDNNPWVESAGTGSVNGKLTTESEEVSIGELAFLDGNNSMVITGEIVDDVSTVSGVVASSFTHKIPIQVQDGSGNKESYYLLVTTS